MVFEADDVVGFAAQRGKAVGRGHRHRENEFLRIAHARGAQGRAGRRARGNAVVNHDRRTAGDIDAFAAAQIALTPPLDLGEFAVTDGLEIGLIDAAQAE